jgi:glycosyltransferase involved in cell wall biosynthesis
MNESKKRILLISCFYYPQNRIPVLRIGQWAKYWSSQGHSVTVLTTRKYDFMGPFGLESAVPHDVEVIEVPFLPYMLEHYLSKPQSPKCGGVQGDGAELPPRLKLAFLKNRVRRLRAHIGSMLDIHDLWVGPAIKAGQRLIAENGYDAVVSSYSPPAVHVVASRLKRQHPDLLWFADFRDLWVNNHITAARGLFKRMEIAKERRTLTGTADGLVTVSTPHAQDLKARYPALPVWVVENGFDPDEFPEWISCVTAGPELTGGITICYAGTIYRKRRDPTPLFNALNELIDNGLISASQISIEFYGENQRELKEIIHRTNSNRHNIIKLMGFVSRHESLAAQKRSNLLLFLESGAGDARGMLTGKVFEYLVSGIPVLALGVDNSSSAGELLERTGTGVCASTTEELKSIFLAAFEFGRFSFYRPDIGQISSYSRDKQAKFIIDRLTEARS